MKLIIMFFCIVIGIAIGVFIATNGDSMKMEGHIVAGKLQMIIVDDYEVPGIGADSSRPDTALVWYKRSDQYVHMKYLTPLYTDTAYDSTMHLKQGEIDTLLHSKANY